jgi:putative phosphoesterase
MRIGVLSDTHNYLDPKIASVFQGVDHILHAGDVGLPWILLELQAIAPVTAVLGNTDAGISLRETEVCELDGRTFLLHHIVNPVAPAEPLRRRLAQMRPAVVVFGHTHRAFEQSIDGTLFFNPGYAGKPRFAQPRSVAVLHCGHREVTAEILPL